MTTETALVGTRETLEAGSAALAAANAAPFAGTQPGVMALALMDQVEFETRIKLLKQGMERLERIKREIMEPGVDYGRIGNIKLPTLLQPGAEKLCFVTRLIPTFKVHRTVGDGTTQPFVHYLVECELHLGDTTGPIVATGVGSANSSQTKHRYRFKKEEVACPKCGVIEDNVRYDREQDQFYCWKKKNGCGAKFARGTPEYQALKAAPRGDVRLENEDPFDLDNTLLKMAKKSSLIDGTKFATASSGMFTQDLDEDDAKEQVAVAEPAAPAAAEPVAGEMTLEQWREVARVYAKRRGFLKVSDLLKAISSKTGANYLNFFDVPIEDFNKAMTLLFDDEAADMAHKQDSQP